MTDLMDRAASNPLAKGLDPSLVGARKVAVVIASLGTEAGARVLGHFAPQEVMAIIREIKDLQNVPSEEARTLFARLQSDSVRLRSLRKAPPANLVERVMASLPKRRSSRARSASTVADAHRVAARAPRPRTAAPHGSDRRRARRR